MADPDAVSKTAPEVTNGSTEHPTDLEKNIIKQIEYYFGDINLPKDKFLREETKKDDGWVPLEIMIKFNRLKELTTDYEVIVAALKKSKIQLIEISEDKQKIRRNPDNVIPEFNEQRREELKNRTLYVKGFPPETTLDELLAYFKEHSVEYVQMKRLLDKRFKGSTYITFHSKEASEKFLTLETAKYGETDLTRETKEAYFKRKNEERSKFKEERQKKKQENQKRGGEKEKDSENQPEVRATTHQKGRVLKLTGCTNTTTREDIREAFDKYGKVGWIDFNKGDSDAWVRFDVDAQEVLDKVKEANEGKVEIKGAEVDAELLEGESEEQYWTTSAKAKEDARKYKQGFNKRGRGRGRGRGGYRGGYRGRGGRGRPWGARRGHDSDGDDGGNSDGDEPMQDSRSGRKRDADQDDEVTSKKVKTEDNANLEPVKTE